jgi:hypothetical protein
MAVGLYFDTMHGTRSGGSAPAPGPAAMQPSAAEPTANVQAVGAAVPSARRIPLPKASELTDGLNIKVPSVHLTPRGCLTKSKRDDEKRSGAYLRNARRPPPAASRGPCGFARQPYESISVNGSSVHRF